MVFENQTGGAIYQQSMKLISVLLQPSYYLFLQ